MISIISAIIAIISINKNTPMTKKLASPWAVNIYIKTRRNYITLHDMWEWSITYKKTKESLTLKILKGHTEFVG